MSLQIDGAVEVYIDELVYSATGGKVASGPFKDMAMPREQGWRTGALSPVLLGCHEEELHDEIERELARLVPLENPKVVNVGCAEGYYAVGLARRLPQATVWAIDTNERCLRIAGAAAAMNSVNLVVGAELTEVLASPDLIVMDCEGAEVEYLDQQRFPGLARASIIVEVHNSPARPNIDVILKERFEGSHHIVACREGPRDPNRYDFLRDLPSFWRWMAVCERRPCMMFWFVMTPKEMAC